MANWEDVKLHPATSWTTQMTIPRELSLTFYHDEIVLTQRPVYTPTHQLTVDPRKSRITGWNGFASIGYNADSKTIFINEYSAPYEPNADSFTLMLVHDSSSLELFTDDGVRSISLAIFPPTGTSRELTPFGE